MAYTSSIQSRQDTSRAQALAQGNKRFIGEPCPKGHTERYVSNGACVICKIASTTSNYVVTRAVRLEYQQKWNVANPDVPSDANQYVARWRKRNPGKVREFTNNRRVRELGINGKHTAAQVAAMLQVQGSTCAHPWCKADLASGFHADHRMPLVLGGSNDIRNIQLLCPPCNQKKGAKHPVDFAQRNGYLL